MILSLRHTGMRAATILAACLPHAASPGPYHFSDILIGDRAMGLGGAFSGVADDSSALYYNPAGLGFASSSNLSAAVNAFAETNREYQKVFAGKDSFFENSRDIIPTFTGGVIDLEKFVPGLHGAFSLQNLSQQSTNQNDYIRRPDIGLEYLHRTEKSQVSELVFNVGAGKRIFSNTAAGISLGYHQLTYDRQQFQDVTISASPKYIKLTDAVAASKSLYLGRSRNIRDSASAVSAEFGGGIIYSPIPWLSIGISAHSDLIIKQSLNTVGDEIALFHFSDLSLPTASDFEALPNADAELAQNEINSYSNKVLQRSTSNTAPTAISYKGLPLALNKDEQLSFGRSRFRLGVAAFPSPRLLLTIDLAGYHTRTEWVATSNFATNYVLNLHQGIEYFFTPTFFIREGLFTNFDARPETSRKLNNPERIDFVGTSLFFGTQTSESQFSLGVIYQYGFGDALKVDTQTKPTPVREDKLLFAFTASHGL